MSNLDVASKLSEIADLLDLLGERFKPEAYRRAARSIEGLPESLEAIAARGELRSVPGVGEAISDKVEELLRTGTLAYLDRLRAQVPAGVLELMRLPGVGPKTARRFWVELGVEGPAALADAIGAGRLDGVRGFAEKKISQLRAALVPADSPATSARRPIEEVWPVATSIARALRAVRSVREVALAGSFRRARETVGDLDVLVTSEAPEAVFDVFSHLPEVREVRLRGPTKETVVLDEGLQVDLRVVEPESFGAALQYFTGSKDHNVRLRALAREHGLKVNEYGVYRGDDRIAGRTEEEVYAALGLRWIPPELREDRGEIATAAAGPVPRLIEPGDLLAEPHVHLSSSPDGAELDRLSIAAEQRGFRWVGVVVAMVRAGAPAWRAPEEVVRGLRRARGAVRLVPVLELQGTTQGDGLGTGGVDGEYVILAPGAGPRPPPRGPGAVRLVAHVGGPAEAARPWLELAKQYGAAVEVGPGPERLDSTLARAARDSGLLLSVATGLGEPDGSPTGPVALGFARRAGATREDVLNARELAGPSWGGPGPAETPRSSRTSSRRKR